MNVHRCSPVATRCCAARHVIYTTRRCFTLLMPAPCCHAFFFLFRVAPFRHASIRHYCRRCRCACCFCARFDAVCCHTLILRAFTHTAIVAMPPFSLRAYYLSNRMNNCCYYFDYVIDYCRCHAFAMLLLYDAYFMLTPRYAAAILISIIITITTLRRRFCRQRRERAAADAFAMFTSLLLDVYR